MQVTTEEADKYQDLFNLMYKKHKVTLTIDEMNELIDEAKKISRLDVVSKPKNFKEWMEKKGYWYALGFWHYEDSPISNSKLKLLREEFFSEY
jgi:hypothetical protein